METTATQQAHSLGDHLSGFLLPSWEIHLRAANRSPKTIKGYLDAVTRLIVFLQQAGMPLDFTALTREHIEAFLVDLLARRSPATAANRYACLQVYFNWLVEEGEIKASPMARIKKPHVPQGAVPVLTEEHVRALFATCSGNSFENRRDTAILRLFFDSGVRLDGLTRLETADVDVKRGLMWIRTKGGDALEVPFGNRAARDLERYLRTRAQHRYADARALWLGLKGPLTNYGIYQIVERRAKDAGLVGLHPHVFRHTTAHYLLDSGMQESHVMQIMGWKSQTMVQRYARATAHRRAIEQHRRMSPGDRV